jgi:hypothetical protein
MNSEHLESKHPFGADRPFPWQCGHCGKDQVFLATTSYDAEVRHGGRLHAFTVPNLEIPVCRACGEKVFTEKVDEQITKALWSHLHLVDPKHFPVFEREVTPVETPELK